MLNIINPTKIISNPFAPKQSNPLSALGNTGEMILARIIQKNEQKTTLQVANGMEFSIKAGMVAGEIGDEIAFEVLRNDDGNAALRQIHNTDENTTENLTTQISIQNLQELMVKNDFYDRDLNPLAPENFAENRENLRQKADEIIAKIKRTMSHISNISAAALGKIAAAGIDINKIPIDLMDSIVDKLEGATKVDGSEIAKTLDAKLEKLNKISEMNDSEIARILYSQAPITLDNLIAARGINQSGDYQSAIAKNELSERDWQILKSSVEKFLLKNDAEISEENLDFARWLIEREIPLNHENFGKLIFMSDIEGNLDIDALSELAVMHISNGENLNELEIYNPEYDQKLTGKSLAHQLELAKIRLEMSYEASVNLLNTNFEFEIDLDLQERAIAELQTHEKQFLTNTLEQMGGNSNPAAIEEITQIYQDLRTLPYVTYETFGAIAKKELDFNLGALENHITAQKYESQATVANLKYGDNLSKIADQFAPLLIEMGIDATKANVKAAQILTLNNMEINPENLLAVKTIEAKLSDINKKLTPIIAARMIAEGKNPSRMHMDEILAYIDNFNEEFGSSDNENLFKNILDLDKTGELTPETRQQMMDIYRMLNRIGRNNGAGIGMVLNAKIELTLKNLMDFSNTATPRNTKNFTVSDDEYYARHLISSFISAAKPKPLAAFVENNNNNFTEPLEESVTKIQELQISENLENIDTENIKKLENLEKEIRQLNQLPINQIKFLQERGLPLSLDNFRLLKSYMRNSGKSNVSGIFEVLSDSGESETAEISQMIQDCNLDEFIKENKTPEQISEEMIDNVEGMLDKSQNAEHITKLDILLQNLKFRLNLQSSGYDHSFPVKLNNRLTDVNMYVINKDFDKSDSANVYISLNTALGEVLAGLTIEDNAIKLNLAAQPNVIAFFENNQEYLNKIMENMDVEITNINFTDINTTKNQLRARHNLPI
ncbi:MAG: DUF6240 domain-containing protein [Defluviitaleaceae bacterium]|nr:DUF6240 domain-containing protein [Defluviitaleaceae bacterium]